MYAAASGKCDVVTELISLGADVGIQNNVSHFIVTLPTTKCDERAQSATSISSVIVDKNQQN